MVLSLQPNIFDINKTKIVNLYETKTNNKKALKTNHFQCFFDSL